jgi:hypothetical protein
MVIAMTLLFIAPSALISSDFFVIAKVTSLDKFEEFRLSLTTNVAIDLKICNTSGTWQDENVRADVGDILEFKITTETYGDYKDCCIAVVLAEEDEESIFNYIRLSANPIPKAKEGTFIATNKIVIWYWYDVDDSWSKVMTFKAKIVKKGSIEAGAGLIAIIDEEDEDKCSDSVEVTVKGGKWIKKYKIRDQPQQIQTYNILSLSGIRNYFANDILVFEKNIPISYWLKNRLFFKRWINGLLEGHPNAFPLLRNLHKISLVKPFFNI